MEIESKKPYLLKFGPNYGKESELFYLFELSEELLKQLEGGSTFKIYGQTKTDPAILTTESSTYKLRRNDFSNSICVVEKPPEDSLLGSCTLTVKANMHNMIDLIKIQPNKREIYRELNRMQLTKVSVYSITEEDCRENILNLNDSTFQISRKELEKYVTDLNLIDIGNDSYLKISEEAEIFLVRNNVLKNIKNSELLTCDHYLDKLEVESMTPLGMNILRKIVGKHFDIDSANPLAFRVSIKKLCAFFALEILSFTKEYYLHEYLTVYKKYIHANLPASLITSWSEKESSENAMLSISKFTIMIDKNDYSLPMPLERKIELKYFNKQELSWDFKERVKEIYKKKKAYFYEELEQIFSDIAWSQKELEDNLTKCTKVIQERLSKANRPFFERIYPAYINNISEDKASVGNFIIRYYTSKLL